MTEPPHPAAGAVPAPGHEAPDPSGATDRGDGVRRAGWWAVLGVIVLTLLMGSPALGRWFDNPDDWDHLDAGQALIDGRPGVWAELFLGDAGIASVRPLPTLLWAFDRAVWGWTAGGYFLTNLLLVAALAGLVTALAWRLARSPVVAVTAGSLVGLSVAANQSLYYLASRDDALANVLLVGAVLAWVSGRRTGGGRWLTAGLAFASALCKPTVALLPLALLAVDRFPPEGPPVRDLPSLVRRQAPVLGALAAYLVVLSVALGFAFSGLLPPQEGGAGTVWLAVRNALGPHLLPAAMRHAQPLLLPVDLPRLGLLAAIAWAGLRGGAHRGLLALGAALFVVGTLPPLPFLSHREFNPQDAGRYLQLPLVGVALACAGALHGVPPARRGRLSWSLVAVSVLTCAVASVPMLSRSFSPAKGLFDALTSQVRSMPEDGRLLVGVSRLDAGVNSLMASDLLERRLGRRPYLFLQGSDRLLRSAREQGERFKYWSFAEVGDVGLDALPARDRVVTDRVGPGGEPEFARFEPEPPTAGPDARWELGARHQTSRRLPSYALWRVTAMGLTPRTILALPPPVDLDPTAFCEAELRMAVAPTGSQGPQQGGPGGLDPLVPSGRFALLLFSEEAAPDRPLDRWIVAPLAATSETQTVRVDLRSAPGWAAVPRVRWLAVVPSDRPADIALESVTLRGCP